MAESLLAHIYSRIKGSQEDVATVSLQYILTLSPELNEAFSRLLFRSFSGEYMPGIEYKCQSVGEDKERPDLAGVDDAGREIILCEAKFYAGLTDNQPNAYLDRLIKNGGKALIFICPVERRVSLWNKVVDLCKGREVIRQPDRDYCVTIDGVSMSLVTWKEITDALRTTASAVAVAALPDIAQLEGFCDMMDRTAFVPFTSEDLGPEVAVKEGRYFQVLDQVVEKLLANKTIDTSTRGLKASASRTGYARYIKINDYYCGILYDRPAWISNTSAETPFWFYMDDDGWNQSPEIRKRLSAISEYEKEVFGGTIGVALKPALYVPLDEVVDDLVKQILEWIERLRN